ncbi:type II toxin-antitoxin system VapC family toxin [Xanthobacteraceae bacterium Astr-EGSB]|uniref:type II toxin-antitoxin system VapC family toxin n=1 Tax=Astrobacterium formosum TaxID=3069710 RepID=UPI0027B44689|nr:type II toxin-antitoxin system VapC family toxin [Xanthobacteraceae bacterium Astr-EGSB]
MTILLDSHAVIWFLTGDRRCSATARNVIENEAGDVLVSAASAWEIATKARLGRWPEAVAVLADLQQVLAENDFGTLDVTMEHSLLAGMLPGRHGDPFDRMLAAQARIEGVPLVTTDPVFRAFDIQTVW